MRIFARVILALVGVGMFALVYLGEAVSPCVDEFGGSCISAGEHLLFSTILALPGLLPALIPDRWNKTAFCVRALSLLFLGGSSCALWFVSGLRAQDIFKLLVFRDISSSLMFMLVILLGLLTFTILGVALYRQIRTFVRKGASVKAVPVGISETPAACGSPEV